MGSWGGAEDRGEGVAGGVGGRGISTVLLSQAAAQQVGQLTFKS